MLFCYVCVRCKVCLCDCTPVKPEINTSAFNFQQIFSYFLLQQTTSWKAMACCGIIIGGFFMGVDQEGVSGSLSIVGVAFGVVASASVALNAIFTKRVLPLVDNNVWRLTLYNNINATILFLPLMVVFGEVQEIINFPLLTSLNFWNWMTISGIFGFAIGYITGMQIQVGSEKDVERLVTVKKILPVKFLCPIKRLLVLSQ